MLENIRESSQGIVAKSILGLIILTFAVAGIGSYTNSVDTSVAEVNGEKISQAEFDKAYQAQRNRMTQQFGDMFESLSADATYMRTFRQGVLDNLINEKLVDQNNRDLAIRVSDKMIKDTIVAMPEFQVDGKFDNNRYLAVIQQAGFFQASAFRDYLRVEMTRRQLTQSLVATEFNLPYQEQLVSALQSQKRDIKFATIKAEQFAKDIEVSEDEINAYYLGNQAQFQNQEKVKVNYIALDVNEIAKDIEVTYADVATYYNNNLASYTKEEQRRVSHILVEFGEDKAAAEEKINAIAQSLSSGEDFAELAKTKSEDTFSGENGGDLEWLERGMMDESFEEAAFALASVGDVSSVVETSFGFHLIKLTDLTEESVQTLADMKDELFAKVSKERAQERFFELQQEMSRLAFEFPDSLEDAASAVHVEIKTSDWLARFGNVAPFNTPDVQEALFSDVVLVEQLNSDIIEVSDELAIVLRVNEHQEATVKPLTEVSATIEAQLAANKTSEKAQEMSKSLLTQYLAGEDITESLTSLGASFEEKTSVARFGADVDNAIAKEAFVLPHPVEGSVSANVVNLANGDLALVQVTSVIDAAEPAMDPNLAQQQTSQLAQSAYGSYVQALKAKAEITTKAIAEVQSPIF